MDNFSVVMFVNEKNGIVANNFEKFPNLLQRSKVDGEEVALKVTTILVVFSL